MFSQDFSCVFSADERQNTAGEAFWTNFRRQAMLRLHTARRLKLASNYQDLGRGPSCLRLKAGGTIAQRKTLVASFPWKTC
jgi:hypothetical protein